MKQLFCLAVLTLVPMFVLAQNSFDDEVSSELDRLYDQSQAPAQQAAPQAQPQIRIRPQTAQAVPTQLPQASAQQVAPQAQPMVQQMPQPQMQQAQPQMQVYKQPTTIIEATPLMESNAEKMRKSRQNSELLTEQKIVEKLEQSRMEDEKRRAEVLFGDKFNQMNGAPAEQKPVAPLAPPVAVVVQEQPKDKIDRDAVRQEITTALDDIKTKEAAAKKAEKKSYIVGGAGMSEYPDVKNVRGNYSFGFSIGQQIRDSLLVEGAFNYGNYHVEQVNPQMYYNAGYSFYPRITNMDQYQAAINVKYLILPGLFRPMVGATAAYTYRQFTDVQLGSASNDATSHAIDVGFLAGADFAVSETLSLGLEYKYMVNLTSRTQTNGPTMSFSQVINNGGTPIEKLGYSTILVYGRMLF